MHNPPHPGEVLREYLGDTTDMNAALQLGIDYVTLNRILTGVSAISVEIASRIATAFGTSAEMWVGLQLQYDLDQLTKVRP